MYKRFVRAKIVEKNRKMLKNFMSRKPKNSVVYKFPNPFQLNATPSPSLAVTLILFITCTTPRSSHSQYGSASVWWQPSNPMSKPSHPPAQTTGICEFNVDSKSYIQKEKQQIHRRVKNVFNKDLKIK